MYRKYIIITDWIKTYLTLEPFMFVKNLEILGWEIIELSKLDIKNIIKEKSIVLCVTYDDLDISTIKCENIILIYKIDDLYPFKDIRNICINNSNMLISPYNYLFKTEEIKKLYPMINTIENFNISYSAVNEFYSNIEINNKPIQKILVSGFISDIYPLRKFIKLNDIFKDYIEYLEHPSYNSYNHNIINKNYYNFLNKYLCCFVDALCFKYVLLKVFEICSVGSLLLVEDSISDELNNLGFYDNINCIMCNENNLENKIKWILNINNRDIIDIIRIKGMELVKNNHNTKQRSIQFNQIIENIYIKKNYLCKYNNDIYFTPDKIQTEYINSGKAEPYSGNIDIVKNYLNLTNRNNIYIDIGVNIGTHSIVFSKLFKKILSFEPDEYNYNQSKQNIDINNIRNIELYNKGLGSKNKKISTYSHSTHSRGCIFTKDDEEGIIECITLDSLQLECVDYIKIDVEGNELDVLKGSIDTILKNSPIIEFEYNNLSNKLFNITYNEIELWLNNIDYIFDKEFESNYYFIKKSNKQIFEYIYKNQLWNNSDKNIPLSGPGSSLENTKEFSKLLNDFIYSNNCKSVLDLGCGDLTWISKTIFFNDNNIQYKGIDVVENLIYSHSYKYPEKTFYCEDITKYKDIEFTSIIIIRDVIFHLTNYEILLIFNNIKNKFKYIAITSCNNIINENKFDEWHFAKKNINIIPFNISYNFEIKLDENNFNRYVYIYKHDNFYNLL